jgi:hypothetical protein
MRILHEKFGKENNNKPQIACITNSDFIHRQSDDDYMLFWSYSLSTKLMIILFKECSRKKTDKELTCYI